MHSTSLEHGRLAGARQVLSAGMELPIDARSKDIAADLAAKVKAMQAEYVQAMEAQKKLREEGFSLAATGYASRLTSVHHTLESTRVCIRLQPSQSCIQNGNVRAAL
jgi:hypothetical protein